MKISIVPPVAALITIFVYSAFVSAQDPPVLYEDSPTGRYGFKDEKGIPIFTDLYDFAYEYNEHGVAAVVKDGKWVYIDKKGVVLADAYIFDNGPDYYHEGLSRYVSDGKIGFINEAAEIIIPARFEFVYPFTESLAAFCEGCRMEAMGEHFLPVGGKWGFVDKNGKIVVPPRFDVVNPFENGRAWVKFNDEFFYIDKKGRRIKDPDGNGLKSP